MPPTLKRLNHRAIRKIILLFVLTLLLTFSSDALLQWTVPDPGVTRPIEAGATFIRDNVETLKMDWKAVYRELINDLGIKHIRIPVYWDQIEPQPGAFNWEALDWQMAEATKANAKIVLAIGHRVPRYPECFPPAWAQQLDDAAFHQAALKMMETTIQRFKSHPALEVWQVENEPLAKILGKIWGGTACREVTHLMAKEVAYVRSLDSTHPTFVTYASAPWMMSQFRHTMSFGSDILGVTVWNKLFFKSPIFNGYIEMLKLGIVSPLRLGYQRAIAQSQNKQLWVAELQAEPWGSNGAYHFDRPEEAYETANPERLTELWNMVTRSGISRIYFWGSEWWLSEKAKGKPQMYDTVRSLTSVTRKS